MIGKIHRLLKGKLTIGGGQNFALNTTSDNTQVRINSRSFTQASGDSIGFQSKPSQTVTTSGTVQGGQISPRVQAAIGAATLIGLHVDTDAKGSTGGNITTIRGLELEIVSDASSGRTITDVEAIKFRTNLDATVSGNVVAFRIPTGEAAGGQWDALAKIDNVANVFDDTDSGTSSTKAGFIKVIVNGNARYIRLYDAAG